MNSKQRKVHKIIWILLAIAIPVLMILSVKDLNFTTSTKDQTVRINETKKGVLKTLENDIIKVKAFKNQLEVILKKPLKDASAVVYLMNEQGKKGNLLGQLTTVGIYKFNTNTLPKGIIVYNTLKETEVTKTLEFLLR